MDRDLIGMRESEEGLNLEKPLEIFDGDGNAQYAAKDLQAYFDAHNLPLIHYTYN